MTFQKIKAWMTKKLSIFVLIFLIIQPLFDVLSYFIREKLGDNTISTLLRFVMLAAIALVGFIVTDRKRVYVIIYSVMLAFFILHAANCFRIGYQSIYSDAANYLRTISLPVYTLSFMTFFTKGENIRKTVFTGFAINVGIIILCTAIPWLIGTPIYTYENIGVGVMGWFALGNPQSVIISLLAPLTIYFGYKTGKFSVFIIASLLVSGLMYVTGTKLTFYSVFLIAAGFMVLFVLNLKKGAIKYIAVLLGVCVLMVVFKPQSPMQTRDNMTNYSQANITKSVNESIRSNTNDPKVLKKIQSGGTIEDDPEMLHKVRKSLYGVYTDRETYGKVFKDLNGRFGVYNVMQAYDYTAATYILSDTRETKLTYANMVWNEKDFLTMLFGFEDAEMQHGNTIFDLENDFPAVFYFCGYVGFAIYLLYFAYFIFIVLRRLWRDPKSFLTVEMGVIGMTFILAIGAAQISGYVLRRPNVSIYFAVIAAYLYHLTVDMLPEQIDWVNELKTSCKNKFGKKNKANTEA